MSSMHLDQVPSRTRSVISAYAHGHDPALLAEDVVFRFSGIPQALQGREAVNAALNIFYHDAFDGSAEMLTIGADSEQGLGVLEFIFRGRHIGDFMGIPATGRNVELTMVGIYHIEDNLIRRAQIYFDSASLLKQLE